MERAFIISKESKYYGRLDDYIKFLDEQKIFINKFCEEKGIEAKAYRMGGNGGINCAFDEWKIKDIYLYIIPTENDKIKFDKMLCKADEHGARSFKLNTEIAKDFAQRCIDEKIIINVHEPRLRDYFKSLGLSGYKYHRLHYKDNETIYLKIDAKYLDKTETPEGFTEIQLSEFYKKYEEIEEAVDE